MKSPIAPAKPRQRTLTPDEQRFGRTVIDLARAFGVRPQEVALTAVCIIGNLGGTKAGVLDVTGGLVGSGSNLILVGDPTARSQAALERLMQPAQASQEFVRRVVGGCPKAWVDLWHWGQAVLEKGTSPDLTLVESMTRDRRGDLRIWCKALLQHGPAPLNETGKRIDFDVGVIPPPRDPGAGVFYRPNFLLRSLAIEGIRAALPEAHDGRAFVFDPSGRLWESSSGAEGGETLARLLHGEDRRFPPVHANQGYGSHWHAKVGLLSTLPMDRVAQFVSEPRDPHSGAVEHCLLMRPSMAVPPSSQTKPTGGEGTGYDRTIFRVVGARINDEDAVYGSLAADAGGRAERLQEQIFASCYHRNPAISRQLVHLANLGYRILWALRLLRHGDAPDQIVQGAFSIALAAIKEHIQLLEAAISHGARAGGFPMGVQRSSGATGRGKPPGRRAKLGPTTPGSQRQK